MADESQFASLNKNPEKLKIDGKKNLVTKLT